MKRWISTISFCMCAIAITVILGECSKWQVKNDAMAQLAIDISPNFQVKQIIVAVAIYIIGYLFIMTLKPSMPGMWYYILAFPVGIACWCIASLIVTVVGIPYCGKTMLIFLIIFCTLIFLTIWHTKIMVKWNVFFQSILIFTGIAVILSCGVLTILLSYDSAYFIVKYGQVLVIERGFSGAVQLWMQWTGLMPAYLSSLAYMCGFENFFTMHHLLMLSFIAIFALSIYEQFQLAFSSNVKRRLMTAIVTILLVTAPAFHLIAQFVISNAYFFVYMFLLVILSYRLVNDRKNKINILIGMIVCMLTLSRIEGLVVVCFLIICISTLSITTSNLFWTYLVPTGIAQVVYWGKMILVSGIPQSDQFDLKYLVVSMLVYIGTVIYILAIRNGVQRIFQEKLVGLMMGGLTVASLVLLLVNLNRTKVDLNATLYNVANEYWGTFPWIALLVCMLAIRYVKKIETYDLIWLGYIIFNFAVCICRFNDLRRGFGDSYNRILCGVIPLFLWSMVKHYAEYKVQNKGIKGCAVSE